MSESNGTATGGTSQPAQTRSWMWREGFEEGWQEGRQDVLRRTLVQRFGALRPEHERALSEASPALLERWMDLIFTAPTAEALFNAPIDEGGS